MDLSGFFGWPLPTLTFAAGVVLLAVSLVEQVGPWPITMKPSERMWAKIIGFLLVIGGIWMYTRSIPPPLPDPTPVPIPSFTATPTPSLTPSNVPPPQPPTRISCDWANDWELQADGTYLWVGSPPGASGCQNVGQRGDLYDRLQNGENLTLVVEVGDTPMGLDICSGSFTATTVIPGEQCTRTPAAWPKVAGTLRVTGSTGFLVGTGR
jgi:hypothetical protein